MRKTKIVATVGPACKEDKVLQELIRAGADVLRINASHSTPQSLRYWIKKIRKAEAKARKKLAILVDLQGPRVRTGKLQDGEPVILREGGNVSICVTTEPGSEERISTNCLEFTQMVKPGDKVLIDNGSIELKVLKVQKNYVDCKVITGGVLGENKGINLPHAPVTLPALSGKDKADLEAAVHAGADYIGLSFVRSDQDVMTLKKWLDKKGSSIPVIAKIEKPRAVNQIESIVRVTDGIMVARGDLGIEMGVEKVPFVQKKLIEVANRTRIPVITATQMLESMIENPRPTRAEASDIANAVCDSTDAVMLSGETSIGKYPVEAVRMMAKIIVDTEKHLGESLQHSHVEKHKDQDSIFINAIVHAARHAAKDLNSKAIVVFTRGGKTAVLLSKFRPLSPIIALTDSDEATRRLTLLRGVFPITIRYAKTTDAMIRESDKVLSHLGFVKPGNPVVILSGRQALPAARYMTKIHCIGDIS